MTAPISKGFDATISIRVRAHGVADSGAIKTRIETELWQLLDGDLLDKVEVHPLNIEVDHFDWQEK